MDISSVISDINCLNLDAPINRKHKCIYKFQKGTNVGKICKKNTKNVNKFFCNIHCNRKSNNLILKTYIEHRKLFIDVFGESESDSESEQELVSEADTIEWTHEEKHSIPP